MSRLVARWFLEEPLECRQQEQNDCFKIARGTSSPESLLQV